MHEAGHAVAAFFLRLPIHRVSIIPEDGALGHVATAPFPKSFQPDIDVSPRIRDRIERDIMCSYAGTATVKALTGRRDTHIQSIRDDYSVIMNLATYISGGGEALNAYLRWLSIRTQGIVNHRPGFLDAVRALTAELLVKQKISGRRARAIIRKALGLEELYQLGRRRHG